MPIISMFFGITVRMYFDDHPPPHFHAAYQGQEAFFDIATGEIVKGDLPKRVARLIKEWAQIHRAELVANWERGQRLEPMERIPGADND